MTLVAGTAIVTGGGSGIGRAIALALAAAGAPVAVVDLLPEGGKAVADEIGRGARFIAADVSRWDDVDRAIGEAVRALGPLGIMVNAAGILDGYAPVHEMSPALWSKVIAINLGVDHRYFLQRGDASLHKKAHEAEPHAVLLLERVLIGGAQLHDARHIGFIECGELSGNVL